MCERFWTLPDAIREHPIRFGRDKILVTVSAGITEYRDGEEFETLITSVDNALYTDLRQA